MNCPTLKIEEMDPVEPGPQSSSLSVRFGCLVVKLLIQNGGRRSKAKLISAQSDRAAREAKKVGWGEATLKFSHNYVIFC